MEWEEKSLEEEEEGGRGEGKEEDLSGIFNVAKRQLKRKKVGRRPRS